MSHRINGYDSCNKQSHHGTVDCRKGWPFQPSAMREQNKQSTPEKNPTPGKIIPVVAISKSELPGGLASHSYLLIRTFYVLTLYHCLDVFGQSMLSLDHSAINPVTNSCTCPTTPLAPVLPLSRSNLRGPQALSGHGSHRLFSTHCLI